MTTTHKSLWCAAALGVSALGVAGTMTFEPAIARETMERPFIGIRVTPDIGVNKPTVRIERVRRAPGGTAGTGGEPYDMGMINFEMLVTNYGEDPIEIDRVITKFHGLNVPISNGWHEGMDIAALMHNTNESWAADGNVISKTTAADWAIAVAGETMVGNGNDYVIAGVAVADGEEKFYVGRRNDWYGSLQAESFPFDGHAWDVAALDGFDPQPVYAVGQRDLENFGDYIGAVVKYKTDGEDLILDGSFGNGGVVEVDLPFHEDERLHRVMPLVVSGKVYVLAAGTVRENNMYRPFLVRLNWDGTPDESFGGAGIKLLPPVVESRKPVALGYRYDPGDLKPKIYLLEAVGSGTSCQNEQLGCTTELSRRNWTDGSLDGTFGNGGTATLAFPDSLSDIPYGLALLQGGDIVVGATRVQQVTEAPWVGLAGLTVDGKINPAFGLWGYRVVSMDLKAVGGRGLARNGLDELAVGGMVLEPGKREVALFTFDLDGNPTHMESNRQDPNETPIILDFSVDAKGQYVAFGYEQVKPQITRFRTDGRLDWRGVIDYDETQRIRWPDEREVDFPTSISGDLFIEEWVLPFGFEAQLQEDGLQLQLPLEQPGELEWWRINQHHRVRDKHRGALDQRYAYDFSMWRWSKANEVWTNWHKVWDADTPLNERFLAYGREVRAARSGIVVGCWNIAPENKKPPKKDMFDPEKMPYGGNVIDLLQPDGSIAHYSHFQPGSIPPELCPNTCKTYSDDPDDPWVPADAQDEDAECNEAIQPDEPIQVFAGDKLGLIGNAGNSTGPHLHFHVHDEDDGRPVYFWSTETERHVTPDPPAGNAVSLDGKSTGAPPLDDVYNLLYNKW